MNGELGLDKCVPFISADLEDPLLYHLVINTGLFSYEKAARLIGDVVFNGICLS